eukprot:4979064-Pyramimonas_sp.AAC.1
MTRQKALEGHGGRRGGVCARTADEARRKDENGARRLRLREHQGEAAEGWAREHSCGDQGFGARDASLPPGRRADHEGRG